MEEDEKFIEVWASSKFDEYYKKYPIEEDIKNCERDLRFYKKLKRAREKRLLKDKQSQSNLKGKDNKEV